VCEFLEHIEEAKRADFVAETFARAEQADSVTHAFPWHKGHHHVNCRVTLVLGSSCSSGRSTIASWARRGRRATMTFGDYPGITILPAIGLLFSKKTVRTFKAVRQSLGPIEKKLIAGLRRAPRSRLKGLMLRAILAVEDRV